MREREGERRELRASFGDLRSSVDRNSSGQEQKFIASTRATHGYQKTRDFAEDPSEEFGKSKVSGLGCVHEAS